MKKINLEFNYNLLANGAISVILGIAPLFFVYFYPINIDLSKLVLFKIFTLILLFAVVWHLMRNKFEIISGNLKKIWPLIYLILFLVFSLPFSIDISSSWFGSYNHQEGLSSWLFFILWSVLLVLHLNANKDKAKSLVDNFLKIVSISGLLTSVYAIFQVFGLDFISWSEPASITGRAVSFFGQPNYLACWLVLILPFSAYLAKSYLEKNKRFFWLSVFIIQLLALLATGSRAVFLIFLLVSISWLTWFLFKEKKLSSKKLVGVLVAGLLLFVLFLSFLFLTNKNRLIEVTDVKKGSLAVRFDLWQTGWESFIKKPILGYGLETQKEVYAPYYKTDFALYSRPNTYSDRAHNIILDILLTSGIVGLIFFAYFLYWLFSNLTKGLTSKEYRTLSFFLIWSLSSYLFSLLFNFSVVVTNIYFWFIVALSFIVGGYQVVDIKSERKNLDLTKIVVIFGFALIFVYGSFIELRKIEADYYQQNILVSIYKKDYFTALVFKDYLDATKPNPVFLDYYNQSFSLRFLETLPKMENKSAVFIVKQYLVTISKKLNPVNFENQFVKAFILGATGKRYESEESFQKLSLLSPEMPKIYLAWGDSLMFNYDYEKAVLKFKQALTLLPDLNSPHLFGDQKEHLNTYQEQIQNRLQQAELLLK